MVGPDGERGRPCRVLRHAHHKRTNNGTGTKGSNALPVDGATDCLNITFPEFAHIYYGPFRVPLNPPLELGTQPICH
jgi:hypothetical protein